MRKVLTILSKMNHTGNTESFGKKKVLNRVVVWISAYFLRISHFKINISTLKITCQNNDWQKMMITQKLSRTPNNYSPVTSSLSWQNHLQIVFFSSPIHINAILFWPILKENLKYNKYQVFLFNYVFNSRI